MDSLVLSLRTMFDPCAAEGLKANYEPRFGEDRFHAVVDDGRFEISRGSADAPDATMEADSDALAGLIYAGRPLADAVESGGAENRGRRSGVRALPGALPPFPSPPLPPGSSSA